MMDNILSIGGPLCHANHDMLNELIEFKKIGVKCSSKVVGATNEGFIVSSANKPDEVLKADSVIIAIGYNANNSLAQEIKFDI